MLYRHASALAISLACLQTPAKVPAMAIRTFGQPVHRPPIRLPPAHRDFMRKELSLARAAGLIAATPSPWSAPSFTVTKPHSQELRIALDYRWLNAQAVWDSYPLPNISDIMDLVG